MDIVFKKDNQEIRLNDFLDFMNKKAEANKVPSLGANTYTAQIGSKNIKIVECYLGNPNDRRVYCFLDREGNIFKAASWKAPAKHKRGSIFDPDFSWGRGLGPFGAAYLR